MKQAYCLNIFVFVLLISTSSFAKNLSARDIAEKVFHRDNGKNSIANAQMVLIDSNGKKRTRNLVHKRYKENELERQLIRFLSPPDIDGTGFLTIEKKGWETDQFLFLPALRRTRRIVSSQKDQRFVNSDFTYEDMERHPVDDYLHELKGSAELNKFKCYVLESKPKKGANSQYSKTITLVHKDSFIPLFTKFFDKKNNFIKTYKVLKLKKIQGIWTEIIVSMTNHLKNHKTFIKTNKIVYNTDINKEDLSRKKLEHY
ncbi:MAG: outer membrane lipoprotein-sorting protein [Deltaproteobacteria bacterium]|nr:MAG: outer membrane lipoprotein-sorting protein [Deltaproteobacteria bacterium]